MYISKIIDIKNYRNLSGVKFDFHDEINFIVGQNNVGKTNVLNLLNVIFSVGKFAEIDFNVRTEAIELVFEVGYDDVELGYFEDNFDVDDHSKISIKAIQNTVDDRIEYYHAESEVTISPRKMKGFNLVYYASNRTPSKELNFLNNSGTGKVLNYIIKNCYVAESVNESDLIKEVELNKVLSRFNSTIGKLHALPEDNIHAFIDNKGENIVNRLLQIGGADGRSLNQLGDGLQYAFNIYLNILDLIVHQKNTSKPGLFEKSLVVTADGGKYLPILLCLDEPEIHQHPYRQRALIKSIDGILKNKNEDFVELIQYLFDIDGLIGQMFIVTHSPNILLQDYKQIIRLCIESDVIKASSGVTFDMPGKVEKHLQKNFIYIKEAMFSNSVILVEGDTEFGAIPIFAERLGYDLDKKGVGVLKLDGADAILRCLELYDNFNIRAYSIIDRDKLDKYDGNERIDFTDEIDFEAEVYSKFSMKQYIKYLVDTERINWLKGVLKIKVVGFNQIGFTLETAESIIETIDDQVLTQIMAEKKTDELAELARKKNPINGALLATYVDEVPNCFKNLIDKAVGITLSEDRRCDEDCE